MRGDDQATRQRVLEAAARLFAARGFRNVTVRQICREAGANVAAVNYHFRNKLGLYLEVVQMVLDRMRETSEAAMQAGEGGTAEERLRAYVRVYLHRLLAPGRESWVDHVMAREMIDPTPALDLMVDRAIRPRVRHLSTLVGELLGCSPRDERVRRLVAGIHAQCLFYRPNPVAARLGPRGRPGPARIDALADHIATVSLAGIKALRLRPADRRTNG
jgi:AcrR family transcriptional regulator